MARKQSTSAHANTSNNSDNSTTRHTPTGRALCLVPSVANTDTRCILQSELLLAAFDWTEERGWQISYFIDDAPADVQGEAWRARYFDGSEQPIATSNAVGHASLRLLGKGQRDAVWRIARTVLHQLDAALTRQIETDARAA